MSEVPGPREEEQFKAPTEGIEHDAEGTTINTNIDNLQPAEREVAGTIQEEGQTDMSVESHHVEKSTDDTSSDSDPLASIDEHVTEKLSKLQEQGHFGSQSGLSERPDTSDRMKNSDYEPTAVKLANRKIKSLYDSREGPFRDYRSPEEIKKSTVEQLYQELETARAAYEYNRQILDRYSIDIEHEVKKKLRDTTDRLSEAKKTIEEGGTVSEYLNSLKEEEREVVRQKVEAVREPLLDMISRRPEEYAGAESVDMQSTLFALSEFNSGRVYLDAVENHWLPSAKEQLQNFEKQKGADQRTGIQLDSLSDAEQEEHTRLKENVLHQEQLLADRNKAFEERWGKKPKPKEPEQAQAA